MNSFALLADPVRRRIVEELALAEQPAGQVGAHVMAEFGIGQPAVSNQLRILREAQVVEVERRGSHRIYRIAPGALDEVFAWAQRYAQVWPQRLDALETELVRGRRERPAAGSDPTEDTDGTATMEAP